MKRVKAFLKPKTRIPPEGLGTPSRTSSVPITNATLETPNQTPEDEATKRDAQVQSTGTNIDVSELPREDQTLSSLKSFENLNPKEHAALNKLNESIHEFEGHYVKFVGSNQKYLRVRDHDITLAIHSAGKGCDIQHAAELFADKLVGTLEARQNKEQVDKVKWMGQFGTFLKAIYPMADLCLQTTGFVALAAQVPPLKWATDGLSVVLQSIYQEADRAKDFEQQLERIEFQAARISQNPNFDLSTDVTQRNLMREKSIDLMTGIVNFFNSSLIYFNQNFFVNLLQKLQGALTVYQEAKDKLDICIKEYDQAILDLSHIRVSFVAELKAKHDAELRNKQEIEDQELLKWLSPSYWHVEGQLSYVRNHRKLDSLQWAQNVPEFREWLMSNPSDKNSKERTLWIRGTLGIGKSFMAGYFIDFLRCLHPNSRILYFFCKSGESGLTTARQIICTLAYQYICENANARSTFDNLRRTGFQVGSTSVGFLFEKLLKEPLLESKADIYVVLDGLDEADITTVDASGSTSTTEMNILIHCLNGLSSVRLLFISRPSFDICSITDNLIVKSITDENQSDIDSYVKQRLESSKILRYGFESARIDYLQYFAEKARNIFLWVVLVLDDLAKSRGVDEFKRKLDGFSKASGSMDNLYEKILLRIREEDRKWIREILTWLIVGFGSFSVEWLREAVEFSLDERMLDFKNFVEVECGAFLRQITSDKIYFSTANPMVSISFVHETLRTYVLDKNRCPRTFHIDEAEGHCHAFRLCLRYFDLVPSVSTFAHYAARSWRLHLAKYLEFSPGLKSESLLSLHQFFTSQASENWLLFCNLFESFQTLFSPREVVWEEKYLSCVLDFLVTWKRQIHQQGKIEVSNRWNDDVQEPMPAIMWGLEMLESPLSLGELLGKTSAKLWMFEDWLAKSWMFPGFLSKYDPAVAVRLAFWLAVKYYFKGRNLEMGVTKELQSLGYDNFASLTSWAGTYNLTTSDLALAVAFGELQLWQKAVPYISHCTNIAQSSGYLLQLHCTALYCLKQYDDVIALNTPVLEWARDVNWIHRVIITYMAKNVEFGTWSISPRFHDECLRTTSYVALLEADSYGIKSQSLIDFFEREIKRIRNPSWWIWQLLADAHVKETGELVNIFEKATASKDVIVQTWGADGMQNESDSALSGNIEKEGFRGSCRESRDLSETKTRYQSDPEWSVIFNRNALRKFKVRLRQTLEHPGCIQSMAFSQDSVRFVAACYRSVQVFNLETGMQEGSLSDRSVFYQSEDDNLGRAICFSPDGQYVAVGHGVIIKVWDLSNSSIYRCLKGHAAPISCLQFSCDNTRLVSVADDMTIRHWNLAIGIETKDPIFLSKPSHNVNLSMDGKYLVGISENQNSIRIFDCRTGTILSEWYTDKTLQGWGLSFSPEGTAIVCDSISMFSRSLFVLTAGLQDKTDTDSRPEKLTSLELKMRWEVPIYDCPHARWSPDGKFILSQSSVSGPGVTIWDAETGQPQLLLDAFGSSTFGCIAHAPLNADGYIFATAGRDYTTRIWHYQHL